MSNNILHTDALQLLKELIAIPSFSKEEDGTATHLETWLAARDIPAHRIQNNIWAKNEHFDPDRPTILLNSHHDTVKPNKAYTLDPFAPIETDGKLYGLGSNDAGGCLVSLIAAFRHFYDRRDLTHNLILALSAEEEISGHNGIEMLLPALGETCEIGKIGWGIVGEPTRLQLAVAEKGLLVLDCTTHGKAGHAARDEGDNAIYKAMKDIDWFRNYHAPKVSDLLGPVKMTVTVIDTDNRAHNVIPPQCHFVVDVRVNECYTFEDLLAIVYANVSCEVIPRSLRMRSSGIPLEHPIVQSGLRLGRTCYGSPTTSDKALMPFPALKTGPGDSARSHTADEFIFVAEIAAGIEYYIDLLTPVIIQS